MTPSTINLLFAIDRATTCDDCGDVIDRDGAEVQDREGFRFECCEKCAGGES